MSDLRSTAARFGILAAIGEEVSKQLGETRGDLAKQMTAAYEENGSTNTFIRLPGIDGELGGITLPKVKDAVKITNEKAYTEWVAANAPSEIEYVQVVKAPFRDAHLKALAKDGGADFTTGLVTDIKRTRENDGVAVVVAGVEAIPGVGFKSPTTAGNPLQKDRILDAIRSQSLLELMPAAADQAPEPVAADRIVDGQVAESKYDLWLAPAADVLKRMPRDEARRLLERLDLDTVGGLPALRKRIAAYYAEELAPGVTRAEAGIAAALACTVQGGYSTPEIEAPRIAADRAAGAA